MLTEPSLEMAGGRCNKKTSRVRRASKLRSYLVERETGLEPATTCLEGGANLFQPHRYKSQSKPKADATLGRRSLSGSS